MPFTIKENKTTIYSFCVMDCGNSNFLKHAESRNCSSLHLYHLFTMNFIPDLIFPAICRSCSYESPNVLTLLIEVDGVSPVHSAFYLLASDLYRIHKDFYRSSLRFLGCTDIGDMSKEEQAKHALFLSLVALLGDKVFNFGEWLAH